jgi:hypothetical protein
MKKWKLREIRCPVCFKQFATLSERRVFCSAKCRRRFWNRVSVARRFANPERKRKSLERLYAWKEARRKPKEEKVGWLDITII